MSKKFFFAFSIVLLVGILFVSFDISNNLIFKKNIISHKKLDSIISTLEEFEGFVGIKFNGNDIPYDITNNFYLLTQVENTMYNGNLTADNFEICILKPNKDKDELISSNGVIKILLYNKQYYKFIDLKLTYFPVISLDNLSGKVTVYDNNSERGIVDIQQYAMNYHVRGASTSYSKKPSYKLNILDSRRNKKKVSLLNMRTDDDWVLNSMTLDKSYLIEKLGYHIWENISSYDIEMKYVELFINNEYKGIYCLQEPADFKTYNSNKNSLILSIKRWKENIMEPKLFNDNLEYNVLIDEFELDSKINEKTQIDLLRTFVADTQDIKDYKSDIKLNYDVESFVNYNLFINLISAIDNTYKNEKVLFRYVDGNYYVEPYPWDLDWSQDNEQLNSQYNFFGILNNKCTPKQLLNSEEYKSLVLNKYQTYRNSFYTQTYIDNFIDSTAKELHDSGAILREEKVWGKVDLDKSTKHLKDFYTRRIKQLDEYYGGM